MGKDYKYYISKNLDTIDDVNVFMSAYKNYHDFKFKDTNVKLWKEIQLDYRKFYEKLIIKK